MIFLGLGEDGRVASLFPRTKATDGNNSFIAVTASKPPPQRITITYGVIAAARDVCVIASGEGKADALRESVSPGGATPLAEVIRQRAKTKILTDIIL